MAYKALNIGSELKSYYNAEIKRANLENIGINITAHAELESDVVNLVYADGKRGGVR